MEIEIRFYAQLRRVVGVKSIQLTLPDGSDVHHLLEAAVAIYPHLRHELLDAEGQVYEHVRVLVNGLDLAHLPEGGETRLSNGDTVSIFPAIGGG